VRKFFAHITELLQCFRHLMVITLHKPSDIGSKRTPSAAIVPIREERNERRKNGGSEKDFDCFKTKSRSQVTAEKF
jgi:hypothetical protein